MCPPEGEVQDVPSGVLLHWSQILSDPFRGPLRALGLLWIEEKQPFGVRLSQKMLGASLWGEECSVGAYSHDKLLVRLLLV